MEAKLPDNCQLSIIIWQLFFLRIPAKRIERFFGSFNDKMHEAGFGMTEISFFLKKIYLVCKKKRKLTGLLMESPGSEWAIEDFQID